MSEQSFTNITQAGDIPLTPMQQKAVDSVSQRISVIAGPGSGKTRVLTERIVSLVQKQGVPEQQILALSFSAKAAKEMRKRLFDRLGNQAYKIQAKTFHSFGLQIIRKNFDSVGLNDEFEILSKTSKNKFLRQVLKENNIPESEIQKYGQVISRIKNGEACGNPGYLSICQQYNERIHKANCIDFDDMVTLATIILKNNADICKGYNNMFSHILVDEVQDLNANQIELVKLLLNDNNSLFIVGDDDQCIYEWRGADPNLLKDLSKGSEFELIKLEDNFRSDKKIVEVSNSLIKNNDNRINKSMQPRKSGKKKSAASVTINADSTQVFRFFSPNQEANFIAKEIQKLLASDYKCNDIAILVRNAKQAQVISEELSRLDIPCYEQLSETTAYDELIPILRAITRLNSKTGINRAINYPNQIMDSFDFMDLQDQFNLDPALSTYDSFFELYSNGKQFDNCEVFRARFALLTTLASSFNSMKPNEILKAMYEQYLGEKFAKSKQIAEKLEHLKTLIEIAKDFDSVFDPTKNSKSQFEEFIDYLTLTSLDDSTDATQTEGVNLMTCHKSKGLEFPVVFIPGIQVGTFPNDFFVTSKDEIEAERRLFYVSMTRAIEKLYVTCFADPFIGKGFIKKGFMAEIPVAKINSAQGNKP